MDKKRQKLHALECGPGCTSWICNKWTAGLTTVVTSLAEKFKIADLLLCDLVLLIIIAAQPHYYVSDLY